MNQNNQPSFETILKVLNYDIDQAINFKKRQAELNQFTQFQIIERYKEFAQGKKLGDSLALDSLCDSLIVDCHKKAMELLTKEECAAMHIAIGFQMQLTVFAEMMNAVAAKEIAKGN